MRDNGYDFYGSDEYSEMLLIKPFLNKNSKYRVKTSFEVVEHLLSLPEFLKTQIKEVDLFLFSTELRKVGWKVLSIIELSKKIINRIIFKEKSFMISDNAYIMNLIKKNH